MIENRYSRQLGCAPSCRQAALSSASVLIVGMGGLGSTVSMNLVAAGLGTFIVCDYDRVSISNLNRQLLYRERDLGKKKVHLAVKRLQKINPEPEYVALDKRFTEELLPASGKPDLILDCLDNFTSRIELIAYATKHRIPLVHGAIEGFMGQFSFYNSPGSACPLCSTTGELDTKERMVPSLGACVSILAGLQATEAIKYFTNSGELCIDRLKFFDGLEGVIDTVPLEKDSNCIACSA